MSKFYSFNNLNNNLNLDFSFNYNRYELKETLTDHSNIIRSNKFNNKEISLSINFNTYYSHDPIDHIRELNKEFLLSINDKKLNSNQIGYFNNLSQKNEYLINNQNINSNIEKSLYSMFGVNYKNFEPEFEKNKKINTDRNKISYIEKCNSNNPFFENDDLTENDDLSLFLHKNEIKNFIENKRNFISNFVHYNTKSIYESPKIYFSFVGFFIEKFLKNDNSYISLDKRFFVDNDIIINNVSNINNKILSFKDIGLQYGKTYKYKVSPVYSMTFPKFNDFHLVEDFLFCDIPYFTKDIVCKEYIRPLPPNNIRFKYDKNDDKINISWNLTPDVVGDIKGFQIFKRSEINEPFVLLKQIEYHDIDDLYEKNSNINEEFIETRDEIDSFELNTIFNKSKIEIYSICSIDAHGYVSNYSSQIAVKFNFSNMDLEIDLVSRSGAPINMPNLLIDRKTKFFNNEDKITTITPKCNNIEKISIYATPDFATINTDELLDKNIYTYKEKYKFNIFKLENNENFIDTIKIDNFKL